MDTNQFNEDYYERGIETGVSLYQNYRWMSELTIPMVMTIIDYLHIERDATILDFGCAKGYVVKAFRLLYRKAWGVDISSYAIEHAEDYCYLKRGPMPPHSFPEKFDYCIAKDVFEHIPLQILIEELTWLGHLCNIMFVIVPLGDGIDYRCPINGRDKTHVLAHGENWWTSIFKESGWQVDKFTFRIDGIKDSYYEKWPDAHGFYILKAKNKS